MAVLASAGGNTVAAFASVVSAQFAAVGWGCGSRGVAGQRVAILPLEAQEAMVSAVTGRTARPRDTGVITTFSAIPSSRVH
jgi:hypothetical protein